MSAYQSILKLFIMAGAIPAMAGSIPLIDEIQHETLTINHVASLTYESNPALMFYRDSVSISEIKAAIEYKHSAQPVMEQTGTGHLLYSIGAKSYMRMSASTVVWGNASFKSGTYHNIKWTDCIDYKFVAPYVLGDGTGGDLNTQQYSFSGGITRKYQRWSLGIEADYRAQTAYRNRDPRIKTVVSDLNIKAGASLNISEKYVAGIKGGLKIYNQNCDLDFYNPMNDINTYTLTGMGTYYKRFMGNTNKNSGYNAAGYSIASQIATTDKSGLKLEIAVNGYTMKQQLRNFNNITLGFTNNMIFSGNVSYRHKAGNSLQIEPFLLGCFSRRKGTENLFGTSSGASYDKIGSNSFYRHDISGGLLAIPILFGKDRFYIEANPYCEISNDKESHSSPLRKTEVSRFSPGLNGSLSLNRNTWLWNISINGAYTITDSKKPIWTELDTTSPLGKCQLNNFEMLSAKQISGGIRLFIVHSIKKVELTGELNYSIQHYIQHGNTHFGGMSIGIIF